jgi:peptidoglycan-N-acetylglucosamine deacetylase
VRMVKLGLAAASAAWSAPALAPILPWAANAIGVARTLPPGTRGVALTFDDGPHPQGTPALLDLLAERGIHATFFLVGQQVERYPEIAARIADEGHVVALHGHRHRNLLRVPPAALARDLDRGARTIAEATRREPLLYRPPYGIFSPPALGIVRSRGWAPLLWSRWGHDWRRFITAERIADEVTRDVSDGDVLLLHDADHYNARDSWRRTLAAMPGILSTLARLDLPAVTPQRRPDARA